jgi:hypothetical protein
LLVDEHLIAGDDHRSAASSHGGLVVQDRFLQPVENAGAGARSASCARMSRHLASSCPAESAASWESSK